jgi:hypothetical protein
MARLLGTKNKVQQATRESLQLLIDSQMPKLKEDLDKLDSFQRLKILIDLLKFTTPMLRSIELTDESANKHNVIQIDFNEWK